MAGRCGRFQPRRGFAAGIREKTDRRGPLRGKLSHCEIAGGLGADELSAFDPLLATLNPTKAP